MLKRLISLIIISVALINFFAPPALAWSFLENSGVKETGKEIGGYDINPSSGKPNKDLSYMIGAGIKSVLSFVGVLFLILMIYGGYLWMTASGNEQQVEKAKNLIVAAVIGLIIVMSAYAITFMIYLYSDTAT